MSETIKEKIICPRCGEIVDGEIGSTWPFDTHYGYCEKCSYHILESEWEKAE